MLPAVHCSLRFLFLLVFAGVGFSACRTARPLPVVDAAQPGWRTLQFPALWRPPGRDAPEIAGDLFLTQHADGRALIHFAKAPLPSVTAWRGVADWQIEFQPQRRSAWGKGPPPTRFVLFWVPAALSGGQAPPQISVETPTQPTPVVRLRHRQTGETLTLFRQP
jgi:hypothetical protein